MKKIILALAMATAFAAQAVEYAREHVLRHAQLHAAAEKAHLAAFEVDARGVFKELYERVAAVDLQHLAAALFTVGQLDFAQLVVRDVLDAAHEHQRTCNLLYCSVLLWHLRSPPFQR